MRLFLLLLVFSLEAFEPIAIKNEGIGPITHFYVYGERCSGTNFTQSLVVENTDLKHLSWCHKHFPPWYDLGRDHWLGTSKIYNHSPTDNFLFIIVVRNPYNWIRSLNLQPHHAHPRLKKLPLRRFIREQWILDDQDRTVVSVRRIQPLMDMNPQTLEPFNNVMELRRAKIGAYMQVMERAANVIFVRYEEIRDHPEEFLAMIQDCYGVDLRAQYTPVDHYKGCPYWPVYKPRDYESFSEDDLKFVNSRLDWKMEKSLGYTKNKM